MKKLADIDYDPAKGAQELREFGDLVTSRAELAERGEIQQFFKNRRQLCALMGTCGPHGSVADCLAFEFPIVGDFTADLVVGNRGPQAFLLVELEDARQNSVLPKSARGLPVIGVRGSTTVSARLSIGFARSTTSNARAGSRETLEAATCGSAACS